MDQSGARVERVLGRVLFEIVADALRINLDQLPAGDYQVHVGLYRLQDGQALRLSVTNAGELTVTGDRLTLPDTISIAP